MNLIMLMLQGQRDVCGDTTKGSSDHSAQPEVRYIHKCVCRKKLSALGCSFLMIIGGREEGRNDAIH